MSEIKKVRQSIMQRKKKRDRDIAEKGMKVREPQVHAETADAASLLPQDEESHGYTAMPQIIDSKPLKNEPDKKTRLPNGIAAKAVLSCCLFAGIFLLMQADGPKAAKVKQWTSVALTENFQFAKANAWYHSKFGAPLALLPKNPDTVSEAEPQALPVAGIISESFETNGQGVKISAKKPSDVSAMKEGIVIFAGNDKKTGRTVIVQHDDGSKSIYGNLSKLDVHLYQYVAQNQKIAKFSPQGNTESVYYSVERNKQYVDPAAVIKN